MIEEVLQEFDNGHITIISKSRSHVTQIKYIRTGNKNLFKFDKIDNISHDRKRFDRLMGDDNLTAFREKLSTGLKNLNKSRYSTRRSTNGNLVLEIRGDLF